MYRYSRHSRFVVARKPGRRHVWSRFLSTKDYLTNAFKNLIKVEIQLPKDESYGKFVEDSDIKVIDIQEKVRENIKKAQERQKNDYRKRISRKGKQVVLCEGQLVLLYNAQKSTRKGDRLAKNWSGPFRISTITDNKNVKLEGRKTMVNIQHLKPFHTTKAAKDVPDENEKEEQNDPVNSSVRECPRYSRGQKFNATFCQQNFLA